MTFSGNENKVKYGCFSDGEAGSVNQHSVIGHLFMQNCLKHGVSEGNCTPTRGQFNFVTFGRNENIGS